MFRLLDVTGLASCLTQIGKSWKPLLDDIGELFRTVSLELGTAFGISDLYAIPLTDLLTRLQQWRAAPESLSRWVNYFVRRRKVQAEGMAELAAQIDNGQDDSLGSGSAI